MSAFLKLDCKITFITKQMGNYVISDSGSSQPFLGNNLQQKAKSLRPEVLGSVDGSHLLLTLQPVPPLFLLEVP